MLLEVMCDLCLVLNELLKFANQNCFWKTLSVSCFQFQLASVLDLGSRDLFRIRR